MKKRSDIPLEPSFPPALYAHFPINKLNPEEIDVLLANGYFRNGLHVVSSLGRFVSGQWKPTLMLRIPLSGFQWKKRSRKLLRRNARHFEVEVRPFEPREEIEDLWKLFKTEVHGWAVVGKVSEHLLKGLPPSNFQTYELTVYFAGQLVAFSIFDKGRKSIASLEAVYHPDFQQYSLGYYTMLLELEFAQQNNVEWYYPGFLPKGLSMFEYKLKPGGVEFFRPVDKTWKPWGQLAPGDWLAETVLEKLQKLQARFGERKIHPEIVHRFHINLPGGGPKQGNHQILMEFIHFTDKVHCRRYLIGYDILTGQFEIFVVPMKVEDSSLSGLNEGRRFVPNGPLFIVGTSGTETGVVELCGI